MWQDAIHLETMISSNYRHIGAGVATSGDFVYYTIDVGYIAGDAGPGPKGPTQVVPPGPGGTPAPTAIAMIPIQVATPKPDGSIIHVVQYGQFLINIAKAYDVSLKDILALNYLSQNTVIFPGDKLLIKPSGTPNGTPQIIDTGQATPTGVKKSKPTASPTAKQPTSTLAPEPATPVAIALAPQEGPPSGADLPSGSIVSAPKGGPDYLLIVVFILAVAGSALVALGTALKRVA
jgi:LysM repeat protein